VKLVLLDMPLERIHKSAFKAAEAAQCAGDQGKFWEMRGRLFEDYRALEPFAAHAEAIGLDMAAFENCMSSGKHADEIRRDMSEARKAGVTGTPAFVLARTNPKGSKVRILAALKGAQPFTAFKSEIDRLLEEVEKAGAGDPVDEEGESSAEGVMAVAALRREASPVEAKTLDGSTVEELQRVLTEAPEGSPAWIAAPRSDPKAIERAEDLARVFSSAGWKVASVARSAVNVKPGYFLFAGDVEPPGYVDTARRALEAAGLEPMVATGYRDYYAERTQSHSDYRGFPFALDQTFLLVVGRVP
jgi:hypothetical protein